MIRRDGRTAQLLLPGDSVINRADLLRGRLGIGGCVFVARWQTMRDSKQPILNSALVSKLPTSPMEMTNLDF